MLTTNLANDSGTLLNLVRHHAKIVEPIVLELLATIPLVIGADTETWVLYQSRQGANSFALYGRGKQYHFRNYDHSDHIAVFDSYQHGKLIGTIRNRTQAQAFIRSMVP